MKALSEYLNESLKDGKSFFSSKLLVNGEYKDATITLIKDNDTVVRNVDYTNQRREYFRFDNIDKLTFTKLDRDFDHLYAPNAKLMFQGPKKEKGHFVGRGSEYRITISFQLSIEDSENYIGKFLFELPDIWDTNQEITLTFSEKCAYEKDVKGGPLTQLLAGDPKFIDKLNNKMCKWTGYNKSFKVKIAE